MMCFCLALGLLFHNRQTFSATSAGNSSKHHLKHGECRQWAETEWESCRTFHTFSSLLFINLSYHTVKAMWWSPQLYYLTWIIGVHVNTSLLCSAGVWSVWSCKTWKSGISDLKVLVFLRRRARLAPDRPEVICLLGFIERESDVFLGALQSAHAVRPSKTTTRLWVK